jgi:hypothetical protein
MQRAQDLLSGTAPKFLTISLPGAASLARLVVTCVAMFGPPELAAQAQDLTQTGLWHFLALIDLDPTNS